MYATSIFIPRGVVFLNAGHVHDLLIREVIGTVAPFVCLVIFYFFEITIDDIGFFLFMFEAVTLRFKKIPICSLEIKRICCF